MKRALIDLYSFDELDNHAQQRAIQEYRKLMLSVTYLSDFENEEDYLSALNEIQYNDDYIIQSIRINDYLFYKNGKLAHTVLDTTTGREVCIVNDEYECLIID